MRHFERGVIARVAACDTEGMSTAETEAMDAFNDLYRAGPHRWPAEAAASATSSSPSRSMRQDRSPASVSPDGDVCDREVSER